MAREMGWETWPGFAREALAVLAVHDWPGNVRELKNVAERAVYRWSDPEAAIAEVQIDPFASPYRPAPPRRAAEVAAAAPAEAPSGPDASRPLDLQQAVADTEERLLRQGLAANRYHQRATAEHLGLSYHQLRSRLRKHGLVNTDA